MKIASLVIATLLAVSTTAGADELTLNSTRNMNKNTDLYGLTYGASVPMLKESKIEVGFLNSNSLGAKNTQVSAGLSVPLWKFYSIETSVKAAGVYVNPDVGVSGYGLRYGAEVALPVSNKFSLVAGVNRLDTQKRVRAFEGNSVMLGGRLSF